MNSERLAVYFIADPEHIQRDLLEVAEEAIAGGVTMVQLRAKSITDRERVDLALRLRRLCMRHSVPLIINDRLDIALAVRANGVHLGVDDLQVRRARQLAPPGFIVGFSPETDEQITSAGDEGADYLGIGPVFGTATKSDAGPALGVTEFTRRLNLSPLPVVAIGGIVEGNVATVLGAGAAGVAVVSAILQAGNPEDAARALWNQVTTKVR